ncbi:MAG: hypothetical protein EA374_04530 [Acholeplasmatales bacterium]|nr:MAG: hypothetical protein EA374_04530 [Acholeplasmatales bacterium]
MMKYHEQVHRYGRIWMFAALLLFLSVPFTISLVLGEWPQPGNFISGFIATAIIFWTVTTIEVFTFSPMLGSGGTYLGFVTGNLTNLKVPAAMQAMHVMQVKMGSEEGDVISTIAIAASTMVTTLIIMVGAFLLLPLTPLLEAPVLQPAFGNIIPALFGALGVIYITRNWKVALPPILFMATLFLLVPAATDLVGVLVPVGCLIAVVTARILYLREHGKDEKE